MQASRQWSSRAPDERFTDLLDMQAFKHRLRDNSLSQVISSRGLNVRPVEDDPSRIADHRIRHRPSRGGADALVVRAALQSRGFHVDRLKCALFVFDVETDGIHDCPLTETGRSPGTKGRLSAGGRPTSTHPASSRHRPRPAIPRASPRATSHEKGAPRGGPLFTSTLR
jgi:hypothetical protein